MSVDGVNNSNSNSGLYAAGAALVGGGAGAGIGYATKSILKDGNYSDEFISSAHKKLMNTDQGKTMVDLFALDPKSETYLTDCVNVIKKHAKTLGIDAKEVTSLDVDIAKANGGSAKVRKLMESLVAKVRGIIGEEITIGKESNLSEIIKKHIPEELDEVFDRSKKSFKSGVEESNDVLKCFKSAQKSLKLKAAGIYGAIGASVLGLGTLLCCGGKKDVPQPKETVNTQA